MKVNSKHYLNDILDKFKFSNGYVYTYFFFKSFSVFIFENNKDFELIILTVFQYSQEFVLSLRDILFFK